MAVNKPVGDNARKSAVKKRSQVKTNLGSATAWTKRSKKVSEFMAVKKPAKNAVAGRERQSFREEARTRKVSCRAVITCCNGGCRARPLTPFRLDYQRQVDPASIVSTIALSVADAKPLYFRLPPFERTGGFELWTARVSTTFVQSAAALPTLEMSKRHSAGVGSARSISSGCRRTDCSE